MAGDVRPPARLQELEVHLPGARWKHQTLLCWETSLLALDLPTPVPARHPLPSLRHPTLSPPVACTQGTLLASSHLLFFQPAEAASVPAAFAASMRQCFVEMAAAAATAPAWLLAGVGLAA